MSAPILQLPSDPWNELWRSFQFSLKAEQVSPRTLRTYTEAGEQFYAFLRDHDLPSDPKQVTKRHCERFLVFLAEERKAKPATLRARFSALRRFFKWAEDEHEIDQSPMIRMHAPNVPEDAPPVLTEN